MRQRKELIPFLVFQIGLRNGISIQRLVEFCSYLSGEVQPYAFNNTVLETKSDMACYDIAYTLYKVQFENEPTPAWYRDYQVEPPPSR